MIFMDDSKKLSLHHCTRAEAAQFFQVELDVLDTWIQRGATTVDAGEEALSVDALEIAAWVLAEPPLPDVRPGELPESEHPRWMRSEIERTAIRTKHRLRLEAPADSDPATVPLGFLKVDMTTIAMRAIHDFGLSGDDCLELADRLRRAVDIHAARLRAKDGDAGTGPIFH